MSYNRTSTLFNRNRFETLEHTSNTDLRGFTTNPFASSVRPAQLQVYQAAFLQAQKELQKQPRWLQQLWN
jgi:hypothetical protein